jgi:two-component system, cell cycle sensor histidine kinase and response regulator CckA
MLERTLGARVRLVVDTTPQRLFVRIDLGQLEQVITNLAVNARDAMPEGGTLTITTRAAAGGVTICVGDTGVGIPPDILPDVFEPFFTTKGPDKGTGLGLATVREVVQRNGGRVGVTSRPGAGTTFELWLPAADGEAARPAPAAAQIGGGRGESVLLIEDDPAVREGARRVLAGAGYAVHEAETGEDALAHAAGGQRIDVVVADIELPGISGVECVRQLGAGMKVVYASGLAPDPRGGDARFLPKPYSPDDLLRSVRKSLDT